MTLETHPNPQANPYHRKIELQSPLDLIYLQSNIARSARAKLDLHFPPSASLPPPATIIPLDASAAEAHSTSSTIPIEDPMRVKVQSLVDAFLQQTWEGAKHSISVNGIDATSLPPDSNFNNAITISTSDTQLGEREGVDFTYAPYDPTLQKRLASLHAELESLTTQVSKLRREVPQKAAAQYGEALARTLEEEQRAFEERVATRPNTQERSGDVLDLDAVPEGWREEVGGTYEHGLAELRRLGGLGERPTVERGQSATPGGSLTEVVGKAQRARTVAMELE